MSVGRSAASRARLWLLLAIGLAASPVLAAERFPRAASKPLGPSYVGGGRVGGDTLGDALPITALPFWDGGTTCGFANDYDEICPYAGSTAPDVVYRYEPLVDQSIRVDLCSSYYDTKVYVWDGEVGYDVACDDDACGYTWQSLIFQADLQAGRTYFIVVDGYGAACGEYAIYIDEVVDPCFVTCPEGAVPEGEPPCQDGYVDQFNSGCDGQMPYPLGWESLEPQDGGCAVVCGRSCRYVLDGEAAADVDWYQVRAAGGPIVCSGTTEFWALCWLVYGTDCSNLQYQYDTSEPCGSFSVQRNCAAGQEVWIRFRPREWLWVPERDYVLEVCGIAPPPGEPGACCRADGCEMLSATECAAAGGSWIGEGVPCEPDPCGPVPVERVSWGRVKEVFR